MSKETGWNLSKPCGNPWKPDSHLVAWKPGTHLLALTKKPEFRMSVAPRRLARESSANREPIVTVRPKGASDSSRGGYPCPSLPNTRGGSFSGLGGAFVQVVITPPVPRNRRRNGLTNQRRLQLTCAVRYRSSARRCRSSGSRSHRQWRDVPQSRTGNCCWRRRGGRRAWLRNRSAGSPDRASRRWSP